MATTDGFPSDGRDVLHWLRYGHAETAAVVTTVQLGLLDLVAESPGVGVAEIAQRCQISAPAARAITQVLLRAGALQVRADRHPAGGPGPPGWARAGLRVAPEVTSEVRRVLALDASRVHPQWAALGPVPAWRSGEVARLAAGWPDLTPGPIADAAAWLRDRCRHGYLRCRVLTAATELGVLAAVAPAPATPAAVASVTGLPPGAAAPLLAALDQVGACTRAGPAYRLAPALAPILAPSRSHAAFRLAAGLSQEFWPALGALTEVARTGRLGFDLQHTGTATRYYRRLARYNSLVFPEYFRLARAVAQALAGSPGDRSAPLVYDVGAGSGVWGAAFAQAWPQATIGFLDRRPVLAQTQANAARLGIAQRAWFREVDLATDRLGPDHAADVLIIGQICHTQPAATLPDLLDRCARALRPDGLLVLADTAPDPVTLAPAAYAAFAIKELVATGGSILDLSEYRDLLAAGGFPRQQCHRFPGLEVFLAARDPSRRLPVAIQGGTTAYRTEVVG